MPWFEPDAARVGTLHVQIFIPSADRNGDDVQPNQDYWVDECLGLMGQLFGGATAFPPARGVWRDDVTGEFVWEEPVVVFSYVGESDLSGESGKHLLEFMLRLGRDTNQGEVGIIVDGEYRGFQNFDVDQQQTNGAEDE